MALKHKIKWRKSSLSTLLYFSKQNKSLKRPRVNFFSQINLIDIKNNEFHHLKLAQPMIFFSSLIAEF